MTLRIPEYVTWYGHKDHVIVINIKNMQKHVLNDTAALLWRRIEQAATVSALVDALVREYGVPRAEARKDVQSFVRMLQERKVVYPLKSPDDGERP